MVQIPKDRFALGSYQYLRYPFSYFLDTAAELCGENYGALRARGFVSKDFLWTLSADGIRIQTDGETWLLGENGELTRATENS